MSPVEVLRALESDAAIDGATVRRGYDYADRGRVMRVEVDAHDDGLEIIAVVAGSRIYHVAITGRSHAGGGVEVDTSCSCPMAYDCKHVLAAAIRAAVRDGRRTPPNWRRLLDDVLDETPTAPVAQPGEPTPVAVQVVLPAAPSPRRPYAGRGVSRPRLAVRVVRMGSSGRWVKAGMGWNALAGLRHDATGRVRPAPAALDVLLELRAAMIGRRGYLSTVDEAIDLHDAAPSLWGVLAKLDDAGVTVVCSDPEVAVVSAAEPAELALDLHGDTDAVRLRTGAELAGDWYDAADLTFLGEPAHGVALWRGGPGVADSTLTLAPLARTPARTVRGWFGSHEPLTVPRAELDELVTDYLPRISGSLPVASRDGSVTLPGDARVTLRCAVTWDDAGDVELDWRWRYRYEGSEQQFPTDDPQVRGRRDLAVERALLERLAPGPELAELMAIGLTGPGTVVGHRRLRQVEAMRFAHDLLPQLLARPDIEVVTNGEPPEFREAGEAPEIRFATATDAHRRDRTDWLDLDVVVTVHDAALGTVQVDLPRVLEALASGETTIMIHRGVYCDIDRPEFDRLARLVHDARALSDQPRRGIRVSRQSHGLLAEIDEIGPTEGQIRQWSAASGALRRVAEGTDALPVLPLPSGLSATLRPYQHDGYQWLGFLHRYGLGGILADDMGLGKTVQTLAMIAGAQERAGDEGRDEGAGRAPFLVVAPSSVVGTWRAQAEAFTPGLRVITITGSTARRGWTVDSALRADGPVDVVVTTYTLLRLEAEQYQAVSWAGVVIDEAQTVKNHRSKTYAAIRALDARSRFAITGTPIENNLMELWALLALTAPGLFPHAAAFGDQYAKPIEQEADGEALAVLRRRVRPVMLRRTKDVVATDLPPKQEQVLEVELSPAHRRVYDTHLQRERQRILELLDDLDENRISVLASLTRLRQLSLDPALVDPAHARIGSAKLDQLVERIAELAAEGHRALVFSQFTGFLARVRARLQAEGVEHAYLDGATTDRARVIAGFRDGDAPVFLISLKAGGVGLTLVEADYCFLLDPWWNPAVEAQAIDRTHRIGQTRPVMVYRMVSADTIEQKVMALAQRKADLYRSVLDDGGDGFDRGLSAADISSLLE